MKRSILLILLSVCILCACNGNKEIYEPLKLSYKEDTYISRGMIAACYDDKIYYFSDGNGQNGIYVMNQDGSDNQLVLECQDIQGLQILNNKIYISEQEEEEYRRKRTFGLYKYDLDEKLREDVIHPLIRKKTANGFPGIGGFFIDESENVFLNVNSYNDKREWVIKLMFYQKNDIQPFGEKAVLIANLEEKNTKKLFSLYQLENNYFASSSGKKDPKDYGQNSLDYKCIMDTYGYNSKSECSWWNGDEFANKWNHVVRIWGIYENKVILTVDHVLFAYDLADSVICDTLVFSKTGKIIYVNLKGDNFYAILEEDTPSVYNKKKDKSHQILYKVTHDFSDYDVVKDYGTDGKMIYIDEEHLLDYDGESICLYNMENGRVGEKTGSYLLEFPLKSLGYQIDVAGEWLFIKHYDYKKKSSKLVKKINFYHDLKNN
ncbi:MAG: hypothetical protein Q4E24_07795 [bacterium]|nr:hypothetical protein [bacterium]